MPSASADDTCRNITLLRAMPPRQRRQHMMPRDASFYTLMMHFADATLRHTLLPRIIADDIEFT